MEAYKKLLWTSTVVVVLLIIPLIFYFFVMKQTPSLSESAVNSADTTNEKVATQNSPIDIKAEESISKKADEIALSEALDIDLNNSDETVRKMVIDCSPHPEFKQWIKHKDLIRRSVAIIDNIANGVSPAPHLSFLLPSGEFKVLKKEKIILDPSSYIRYQPLTMVLVSLDSHKLVDIYRQLLPVLEDAFKELGYPEKKIHQTIEDAIEMLLETPIIEDDIPLEEKVTSYAFADPRVEELNEAQKQLIRMGPENIKKIKSKLREILNLINH